MDGHNLVMLDIDPETGKATPMPLEQILDETEHWTRPPEGLTKVQRKAWLADRRQLVARGVPADLAWYWASLPFMSRRAG